MFSGNGLRESEQTRIELMDLDPGVLEQILGFIYTAEIQVCSVSYKNW